tara:strand:+ start:700 stop:2604 length:1905 start_codon:yes stop_codon:yes gene_type:complete
MVSMATFAQDIQTSADKAFYGYAYGDAIREYQKQMQQGKLISNQQLLNLADSFFKTGDYKNASKWYLNVHKNDTIMSDHRFNNLLQSLARTSEPDRVKAFLKTKEASLSNELIENANFNYELIESNMGIAVDFNVFNLSANSMQADMSPSFYKDQLLFSSSRPKKSKKIYAPAGESYLDIYVAKINKEGRSLNTEPFQRIPESEYHKSTPYYSEVTNSFYYIVSNVEDGDLAFNSKGKNALAIAMVSEDGVSRFLLKDLSTSFYYPFYDNASNRLYFAANFSAGYGGTDIYYVLTSNNQVMSEPINLGPRINTPGNELAPYIFEGSLYFSSDVFYGFGGMDVYKSNIQSGDSYSTPVNLGKGLNSESDDFGFIMRKGDENGYTGYFASNRKGGKGNDDIYGFNVEDKPGLKTLLFRGQITRASDEEGIEDVSIMLMDADRNIIKEVFTDQNGNYQMEVPWREGVGLQASKSKHSVYYKAFSESETEDLQTTKLDITLTAVDDIVSEQEEKTVLKLGNLNFEMGKSELTASMITELDIVADIVKEFPEIRLRIESHTDSRGNDASNKRLSQKRADAILNYLRQKGVTADNLSTAIGFGEEKILNICKNGVYCLEFLHNQNARSLIEVLNYEELSR